MNEHLVIPLIFAIFLGYFIFRIIVSGVFVRRKAKERGVMLEEKLKNKEGFTPIHKIMGLMSMYLFAVDHVRREIAYIEENKDVNIPYEKIISIEVVENNTIIASKSSTRTIGGAVVGGALAGGAGAVVGGLSGDSEMKKLVSLIQVRIRLRDIESPVLLINCLDCKAMFGCEKIESNNSVYKTGLEDAQKISDLISVIIDDVDRVEKYKLASMISSPTGSYAEELAKLADLKSKGILTEEEFDKQKSKLLNQ